MSVDRSTYIIAGFILDIDGGGQEAEDQAEALAIKLKCRYVAFNDGYDTICQYALVPKNFNEEGVYSFEELMEVSHDISQIKTRAKELDIKLPDPTIQAVTFTC